MAEDIATAEAEVAAAESALAVAEAQATATPGTASALAVLAVSEQVDRPAGTTVISDETQRNYLNDRGPVE